MPPGKHPVTPLRVRRAAAPACLLAGALLLAGCGGESSPTGALAECPAAVVPIHAVQGRDFDSPRLGDTLEIAGVVTRVVGDGLYVESLAPDDDPRTSEGLFLQVAAPDPDAFAAGTVVTARGQVAELGEVRDTKTALVAVERLLPCGPAQPRPLTATSLPLGGPEREAIENMRVSLGGASVVTDVYRLDEGAFRIALDELLAQATEVERPGADVREHDGRNWAHSLHVRLSPGDTAVFAVGDELLSAEGVMGNTGRGPVLLLDAPARLLSQAPPTPTRPGGDVLRVVSYNLLNYFNGDGAQGGFPAPRGAETPAEFDTQRQRFRASFERLQPDVLAVQELENDGFGPTSAAADLLRDLEAATGHAWAVSLPDAGADTENARIGSDAIAVGLFYRSDLLSPVGPARLLDAAPFDLLSRTPLAQALEHRATGQRLLVAVNHFKSKGSCPEQGRDRDQNDGQGCWNAARRAAADALAPWALELAAAETRGDVLLVGDFNAYRMEDPVQRLLIAGFVDLTAPSGGGHHFSFVYAGESGTLDHALASRSLAGKIADSRILNVNSVWNRRLPRPEPWLGASDHDPVVVDVRLTQAPTSD